MKIHQAVLDIYARLVHLDSPIFDKVSLQLPPVAHLQTYIHAIVAKSLDEIHVVPWTSGCVSRWFVGDASW
jgi:hypothetical protein